MFLFGYEYKYSTNNSKIQTYVDGWKSVGIIQINANKRLARYSREYSKTTSNDVTLGNFDTAYKPVGASIVGVAHSTGGARYIINGAGAIQLVGNGTGTMNISHVWCY